MNTEPSPRPWRVEFRPPRMEKPHSKHEKAHFVDANGRDVWLSRKNAAFIVDAVNERDRLAADEARYRAHNVVLRDLVRRLLMLRRGDIAVPLDEESRIIAEARKAIGKDKP